MTATDLTAKQAKILRWIIAYKSAREIPPTIREICAEFRFSSPNGARGHLDALEKKGYIARDDMKARSIRVLKGPDGKPVGTVGLTREEVLAALEAVTNAGGDPYIIADRLCERWGIA